MKILTDMKTFDHLLIEDIKAFETSGSEGDEDLDDFGYELQQLLSDDATDFESDGAHHQKTSLSILGLELPDGAYMKEEVCDDEIENVVRWKIEPDAEALKNLIDVKVANVKDPYRNAVTVENLESGESSLMKLEHQVLDFYHGVDKESFEKHLDTRAEEAKLGLKPEVFGRKPLPPYRKSKRGTLGVSYKLTMNDLEETIESKRLKVADLQSEGISSSESGTATDQAHNVRSKKKFRHYKEFITQTQALYDQTVISKLLSLPPRKRLRNKKSFLLSNADSSEEDVDSLPSIDTSESDDDDYSETVKEDISISTQEGQSLSVSEKIDNSMPLIN